MREAIFLLNWIMFMLIALGIAWLYIMPWEVSGLFGLTALFALAYTEKQRAIDYYNYRVFKNKKRLRNK